MVSFFLVLAVICGVMSYLMVDPMKSSFFLILSMMFIIPLITVGYYIWYSYFICLLFLSGIFVILVYFSSLSKIRIIKSYTVWLGLILTFYFLIFRINSVMTVVGLNVFYYKMYWYMLMYILLILLVFINFTSYFLNFSGALRKV